MTEAYSVSAQLTMRSNVPEVIAQMVRGFEIVNRMVKDTQNNLGRLSADLRSLSRGGRGVDALVASMEKLSKMKLGGGMLAEMREMATVTREMQVAQAELARSAAQTAKAYQEMAAASRRTGRGGGGPSGGGGGGAPARTPRRGTSHASLADAAVGLQMGGDAGAGFFERSIQAELEVQKLLVSFRQNTTLKEADIAAVRSKAESLVRAVPGTTIAENLHTLMDAYTIVGNLGEAMAGSEAMAKLNLLFSSMPGAKGDGDGGFKAGMAVELMQRFYNKDTHEMDIGAFNQQMGAIAQVAAGTGGRAGAETYLSFVKQARTASMVANDQFLYRDAPATMIALGGSRMGTGMAALFSQLQTGTMTENAANALKGAGLLDKGAEWKGGRVQDIGHHLRGAGQAGENLVEWARTNILGPQGALAEKGIDQNDKLAVARFLSSFTARQTGLGVLSEIVLGIGNINKEGAKIGQTSGDPLKVLQQNDPNMKVKEFGAAQNEMMVQLGSALLGPAIEGMKALTGVLRQMTDWARENPNAAKDIALVAGGMALLAKVAGDLGMVLFIGAPVVKGMAALAGALLPFEVGGATSGALTILAGGGVGSLAALSLSIAGLAGAALAAGVALPNAFVKLNEALGIAPGKGNNGPPSPHGNYLADGIANWWHGFTAPQVPGAGNAARGGHQNAAGMVHPSSYVTPSSAGGMVQVHTALYVDGHQFAAAVTKHQVAGMSTTTGMSGFDPRMTRMPTGATSST